MLERRQAGRRAGAGRGVRQACPGGGPGKASPGDPEEQMAAGGRVSARGHKVKERVSNEATVPEPSVRKHRGVGDQHGDWGRARSG